MQRSHEVGESEGKGELVGKGSDKEGDLEGGA